MKERVVRIEEGRGDCGDCVLFCAWTHIEEDGIGAALMPNKGLEHARQELQVEALWIGLVGVLPRVRHADDAQAVTR